MLKQLTIRGFDADLERALRELARSTGLSLNKAALLLMRRGASRPAPEEPRLVGSSLDDLIGVWTEKEEADFLDAVRDLRRIDPEVWE